MKLKLPKVFENVRNRTLNYFISFAVLEGISYLIKMVQPLIIALLFIAALAYVGFLIYKSFQADSGCSGCGSCGVDFNKIEKELEKKRL